MILGERELGEQVTVCLKDLRCFMPEMASFMGFQTEEAPVFLSAYTGSDKKCNDCGIQYGPLRYVVGGVTRAHHLPHKFEGGIYYKEAPIFELETMRAPQWGWEAIIEPMGSVVGNYLERSEAVKILEIKAFCTGENCFPRRIELLEAVAAVSVHDPYSLVPICDLGKHPNYSDKAKYNFKVTDGEILFNKL